MKKVETLFCDNCGLQFEGLFNPISWYKCQVCGSDLWHMGQRPNHGFHADRANGPDNSEHSPEICPAGEPNR